MNSGQHDISSLGASDGPTVQAWSDRAVAEKIVGVFQTNQTTPFVSEHPTVLDLRRALRTDPLPDTRQMNRVLYDLCGQGILAKLPPSGMSRKPRWSLNWNSSAEKSSIGSSQFRDADTDSIPSIVVRRVE